MRRAIPGVVVFVLACSAVVFGQVSESLREQLKIRQVLLDGQMQDLAKARDQMRETWLRVEQGSVNLMRAQREGESIDSLRLRDDDLRQAEAELAAHLDHFRQARRAMLENRTLMVATAEELRRIEGESSAGKAPLTGTWRLVVDPGQEGTAFLLQQGTLVTGTYALTGGFSGSFRGTLVAGKVRLERIDSQIGFAAIFYGRLIGKGRNARLQGQWEATQLASGLPSSGSWSARRAREEAE
ncbi:MAG: hypothetical protein ACC742_04415 [Thermoanaerobaculales bacterium]